MDRSVRRLDLAFRSVPRQALLAAAALLLAPAVAAGVFAGWNGISDAQARSAGATAVASARQQSLARNAPEGEIEPADAPIHNTST